MTGIGRIIREHRARGGQILVIDASGRRTATPELLTSDIARQSPRRTDSLPGAGLRTAEYRGVAGTASARRPGRFLPPGTFGSYLLAKAAHEAGNPEVAFVETGTLPWPARKQGADEIRISRRGVRLPTGVFPRG